MGHLRKLGRKTHFAKLTRILPLKKAWRCCYKGLFVLSPSPPSSVDCVELKLECITPTLHRGGRGEGRCLNLTSYYVSVPRVLTRVVGPPCSISEFPFPTQPPPPARVIRGAFTGVVQSYLTYSIKLLTFSGLTCAITYIFAKSSSEMQNLFEFARTTGNLRASLCKILISSLPTKWISLIIVL